MAHLSHLSVTKLVSEARSTMKEFLEVENKGMRDLIAEHLPHLRKHLKAVG